MAIYDALFEFSDDQAITGDAQSTDILDWGSGMEDLEMGAGTPIWLNIQVGTVFAGGTSLACALYCHTAETNINTGTLLWQGPAIVQASLTAGAWITRIPLPVNCDEDRYLGVYYDDTGAFTGGTVNAWLDHGPQSSFDTQVAASNI
jgi:hypothetical protein